MINGALFVSGCSTSNQIMRFKTAGHIYSEAVIPGVEAEEGKNTITIMAHGRGLVPPDGSPVQRRFLAERAAVVDAYRQLTERLAGMMIEYHALSGNNSVSQEQIMLEAKAFLRGAHVSEPSYRDGYAAVSVRVFIEPRETKFFTGSSLKRGVAGALGGAVVGGTAGGAAGALTGTFTKGVSAGSGVGAVGGIYESQ